MTTRRALILYAVFQVALFWPILFKGWVIYPHDNRLEVGLPSTVDMFHANRKFSDESRSYIPNLYQHLRAGSWNALAVIDPSVQLGKPLGQLGGLSRAYLVVNFLSFFTPDPLRLLSFYIVITIALGGVFCGGLLRSYGVSGEIALLGAVLFSQGVFLTSWQPFPMTISLFVWSMGLLLFSRLSVTCLEGCYALGVGFCVYSLLMTAGPQGIVLLSYLFIPYVLSILWSQGFTAKRLFHLMMPGVLGGLAALPVYIDLMQVAERSSRTVVHLKDYVTVLPSIDSIQDFLRELTRLFDVFLLQSGDSRILPYSFNGHCFLPVCFVLFLLSFAYLRGFWILKAYTVFCLLGAFSRDIYAFYFHYLGFSLSRCLTLGGLVVVVPVLAMLSFDTLRRQQRSGRKVFLVYGLLLAAACLVRLPSVYYLTLNISIFLLFLAYLKFRKHMLLIAIIAMHMYGYSAQLTFFRPQESIRFDSPILSALREVTEGGTYRFAKIGLERDFLSSNQESMWGLKSIHSNDSLSSRDYRRLIESLSSLKTGHYGRISTSLGIDARLDSPAFSYLGVSGLVSRNPIESERFVLKEKFDNLYLYRSRTRPHLLFSGDDAMNATEVLRAVTDYSMIRDKADRIIIDMNSSLNTGRYVMLSEQWHPKWRAYDQDGKKLNAFKAREFYLGVHIRPTTRRIVLHYQSPVQWALISQVGFVIAFLYLVIRAFRLRLLD